VQKKLGLPPSLLGNNLKFIIQVLWFVHNHCPCISLAWTVNSSVKIRTVDP
jgi:hypothetical protein